MIGAEENTKTQVKDGQGAILHSVETNQVLRCTQTNAMWLAYQDNIVEVGKYMCTFCTQCTTIHHLIFFSKIGHGNLPGYAKILSFQLPDFNIQTVGMSLPDDQGFWDVQRNFSTIYIC